MNESEDESLKGALALAERVALEAGAFLRSQMYGLSTLSQALQPQTAEVKSDADREAEDLIREGLCEAFPQNLQFLFDVSTDIRSFRK